MTTARTRKTDSKPETATNGVADGTDWDALFETAELSDRDAHRKRPVVDVPDKVVEFAQKLFDNRKTAKFPVSGEEQFNRDKIMWQSAGDKTTPMTSATVTAVTEGDGDDVKVVGLKVTFGVRRGAKNKTDKADA